MLWWPFNKKQRVAHQVVMPRVYGTRVTCAWSGFGRLEIRELGKRRKCEGVGRSSVGLDPPVAAHSGPRTAIGLQHLESRTVSPTGDGGDVLQEPGAGREAVCRRGVDDEVAVEGGRADAGDAIVGAGGGSDDGLELAVVGECQR